MGERLDSILNKGQESAEDKYRRFTDEEYLTKKMVASELRMSLIDGIWKSVNAYRMSNYAAASHLINRSKRPFHYVLTSAILSRLSAFDAELRELDALCMNLDESGYRSLAVACCARYAEACGEDFSSASSALKVGAYVGNGKTKGLGAYYGALSRFSSLPHEDSDDFLDALSAELGIEEGTLYRDVDKKNIFTRLDAAWEYGDGVLSRDIPEFIEALRDYILDDPRPCFVKALVSLFYLDFISPFSKQSELLSYGYCKHVLFVAYPHLAPLLPIEGAYRESEDHRDFTLSCLENNDLNYPIFEYIRFLSPRLRSIRDDLAKLEAERPILAEKAEEKPVKADEPLPVAEEKPSPIEPLGQKEMEEPIEEKAEKPKAAPVPRIDKLPESQPSELALYVPRSGLSEKELKEAARYIAETHPSLKRSQANFYVSHCAVNSYYTIADYKKWTRCAYETARTSMDKLAEEGFYRKLQIKNKYVYTPIKRNG